MNHILLAIFLFIMPVIFLDIRDVQGVESSASDTTTVLLDSDLDGLTDTGEETLFGTDAKNPDTDGDGWYDGTEIIEKTDPLDVTVPSATTIITTTPLSPDEEASIPWAWYITRASGIIAFAFAWIVVFLGVAIRLPMLRKFISPVYSLSAHHALAFQTLFFAIFHGFSFLFDSMFSPTIADILIPFHFKEIHPLGFSLGILGLYGLAVLTLTSWFKPMLPQRIWRATHFLNVFVYIAIITHAIILGTDLKNTFFGSVFIAMNCFLGFLLAWNIFIKIHDVLVRKQQALS